jgi:hypothetical protein
VRFFLFAFGLFPLSDCCLLLKNFHCFLKSLNELFISHILRIAAFDLIAASLLLTPSLFTLENVAIVLFPFAYASKKYRLYLENSLSCFFSVVFLLKAASFIF